MNRVFGTAAEQVARIVRPTLLEEITTRIRDSITEGALAPGERINESRLCSQLGVSRTPLREALRFLASEGLIDLVLNRGAIIRSFSPREVHDALVVLSALESLAGRLACVNACDGQIVAIRRLHDEMMVRYRQRDRLAYYKLNQAIHTAICALSGNAALTACQGQLQSRLKRIRYIGHEGAAHWTAAVSEHEMMIAALEARDGDALAGAMAAHMDSTARRVASLLSPH